MRQFQDSDEGLRRKEVRSASLPVATPYVFDISDEFRYPTITKDKNAPMGNVKRIVEASLPSTPAPFDPSMSLRCSRDERVGGAEA